MPRDPQIPTDADRSAARLGVLAAGCAYATWGLTPIYFKAMIAVPALEIIAHRVLWSVVLLLGALLWRGQLGQAGRLAADPAKLRLLALTSALVIFNWFLFVWAVNAGRVLDTSLGYFMMPLMYVLLGRFFLHERLSAAQWLAVALAAAGVGLRVIDRGELPWVSLLIALSFGFYGLLRKREPVDSFQGLLVETALALPLALAYLIWLSVAGSGHFGAGELSTSLLLVLAGPITAIPLLLFAIGARRLRLTTMGFLQYIGPTLTFLLAVFIYGEAFSLVQGLAFALIWMGLAVYSTDLLRRS
jgi:chloramphenicol-sensitive protein RarD